MATTTTTTVQAADHRRNSRNWRSTRCPTDVQNIKAKTIAKSDEDRL